MKVYCLVFAILALIACSSAENIERAQVCRLPATTGPCQAYFPRFAYDSLRNDCVSFVYGGCQGNDNNFESEEECRKYCEDV